MHGIAFLMLFFLPNIVMLSMNWHLGLIALIGSLLISGYAVSLALRLFRSYTQCRVRNRWHEAPQVQESQTVIRTVKVLGAQWTDEKHLGPVSRVGQMRVARLPFSHDRLSVTRDAVLNFLYAALIAAILPVASMADAPGGYHRQNAGGRRAVDAGRWLPAGSIAGLPRPSRSGAKLVHRHGRGRAHIEVLDPQPRVGAVHAPCREW